MRTYFTSEKIPILKAKMKKKEARKEKKKKKITALAQIMKLNELDEKSQKKGKKLLKNKSKELKNENKLENNTSESKSEPHNKKLKLDLQNSDESNQSIKSQNNETQLSSSNHSEDDTKITSISEGRLKQKHGPKIKLNVVGEKASLSTYHNKRVPIVLTDIQHLIMPILAENDSSLYASYRWFELKRRTKLTNSLMLVVEGMSLFHFFSYESKYSHCNKIFSNKLEVIMPPYKEGCIIEELSTVPTTTSCKTELIRKYGSLEAAVESIRDSSLLMKALFPIDDEKLNKCKPELENYAISRTNLLLSVLQMVEYDYPLPMNGALAYRFKDYVFTKDAYKPVTEKSPLFGVDCEMCRTIKNQSELTRISIVNEDLQPVYETLVRPNNKIIDYLTPYSGITSDMMISVTKTLDQVQAEVREILPPDAILIGQSLNVDLHAMKMMHPYIIDTSVIYNLTGDRRKKSKLRVLVKEFLGEDIQVQKDGHDSLEDSRACVKLVKLKLAKGLYFGDEVLQRKKGQNEMKTDNLLRCAVNKRTAIVTAGEISAKLKEISSTNTEELEKSTTNVHIFQTKGNKSTVKKTKQIIEKYDLTISNLCIPSEQLELSEIDTTIATVDDWIGKLWETVPNRGLFIVLFGGAQDSSNGIVMVKIKTNSKLGSQTSTTSQ